MTRTITVTGRTGRMDVPSFTLAENEALTVTFNTRGQILRGRTARHSAEKDLCTIGRQVNRAIGGMAECGRRGVRGICAGAA